MSSISRFGSDSQLRLWHKATDRMTKGLSMSLTLASGSRKEFSDTSSPVHDEGKQHYVCCLAESREQRVRSFVVCTTRLTRVAHIKGSYWAKRTVRLSFRGRVQRQYKVRSIVTALAFSMSPSSRSRMLETGAYGVTSYQTNDLGIVRVRTNERRRKTRID